MPLCSCQLAQPYRHAPTAAQRHSQHSSTATPTTSHLPPTAPSPPGKPLRMPISDVFKTKQGAVTVGGKLEGGALRPGSKVLLVPGYEPATVKSIEVSGQAVQLARAGDSADVVLTGVDAANLAIGAVLCHLEYPVPVARKVEMQVVVLDVTVPVLKGQAVTLHAHCTREAGHISALLALLNAKTGGWSAGGAAVCCWCAARVWASGCEGGQRISQLRNVWCQ
jgi:translation elongation factor EF-1alpha